MIITKFYEKYKAQVDTSTPKCRRNNKILLTQTTEVNETVVRANFIDAFCADILGRSSIDLVVKGFQIHFNFEYRSIRFRGLK